MARSGESKCGLCGNKFLTVDMTTRSGKKYCTDCIEIKDKENEDWSILFEYIKEIYKLNEVPILIITQLNKYRKDEVHPLTSIGMYYTLKYYYEILDNEIQDDKGVGIIPYYYDQASRYYSKVFDLEEKAEYFEFTDKKQIIKTKRYDTYNKKRKQISLEAWRNKDEDED
jgi:hypothetical protein